MTSPQAMVEIWRGTLLESQHLGHGAVCDETGEVLRAWGDPNAVIYPRSSSKMIQALPLLTSGAADRFGLNDQHLALACASHNGAAIHSQAVRAWLDQLGLDDSAFRCGLQDPADKDAHGELIRANQSPCQYHNNCSGKHSGFLTLSAHMGAGPDYVEIDHPVQQACRAAFEDVTAQDSPTWGIDGCSAPNFATTVQGMARAMAWFASAETRSDRGSAAAQRLTQAMMSHPEMVAGEGRACTHLMRAMDGAAAVKTGAEGVYVAILPTLRLGVTIKIADGATRASECAIATILCGLGVLDPNHPATQAVMNAPILNRRDIETGTIKPTPEFVKTADATSYI
ncbi:MAG: asparaginase [Sedimentitalea sp.]